MGASVSAADPARDLMILSNCQRGVKYATQSLRDAGFEPIVGSWSLDGQEPECEAMAGAYVAVVAYRTKDQKPGIWIDAFATEPTPADVLKRIYDEFRETGELPDVPFEEFMRLAFPNVAIVSPEELSLYSQRNQARLNISGG